MKNAAKDLDEFACLLREASELRDSELRNEWGRSLPFGDAMFDRWERAKRLGFGEGTSIYDSACVFGDVSVGRSVWIGPWAMLDGSGGLEIGNFVSISAGVQIYSHDTVMWALSGGVTPARLGRVKIGSNVYLGSHAIIAKGVSVGDRCVISANSLVLADVPDSSIFGGTPARQIGRVVGSGENVFMEFWSKGSS